MRTFAASLLFFAATAFAQDTELPAELQPLFPNVEIVDVISGDLDRTAPDDFIVITEPAEVPEGTDPWEIRRTLHIVTVKEGKPQIVKSNDRLVLCAVCGGMMGEPYVGTTVENGRFTVEHYGGSGWRWSNEYTFAWSRRDQTWQLVRVKMTSFHAGAPDDVEETVQTPPKDFGKIDLADFDPETYAATGEK